MLGQTVAHYLIIEKLGEGGMGVVYKARDTTLSRFVALKFLQPMRAGEEERLRFHHEAQAASALDHPNICTVYEVGETEDGMMFIAMAYYEGETLAQKIDRGAMEFAEAASIGMQIAQGLAKAHANGITHRDLKPNNVIITKDGLVKIVDFGLAKLAGVTKMTKTGSTMGTPRYMSPEQVRGEDVDRESDVWSLGAILYEMLAGRPAFGGGHEAAVYYSILELEPDPLKKVREGVPDPLARAVERALVKDRGRRGITAADMAAELQSVLSTKGPVPGLAQVIRQPQYAIPALAVLIALGTAAGWWWVRQSRIDRAINVTLPEARKLFEDGKLTAAWLLAREARQHIPNYKEVNALFDQVSFDAAIRTNPAGAEVFLRDFNDAAKDAKWERIGVTPVQGFRLPLGHLRLRAVKQGYRALEVANVWPPGEIQLRLHRETEAPEGMVFVPGGRQQVGGKPVEIQEYWIDRLETTNEQFKGFVDAGGYRKREYWKNEFVKNGKKLSFEDALNDLQDTTGRPGPSTWEVGSYAKGQEKFPAGGISWYEAAAYCEWQGKSLPTVYHWDKMSGRGVGGPSALLEFSNFGDNGPAPVGSFQGLGPFGTYDTAGNVKEWTWNGSGDLRYILGGSWGEPIYLFKHPVQAHPFDRSKTNGVRCAKYTQPVSQALLAPVELANPDRRNTKPVNDQVFETYRSFYAYDKTPLKAVVEKSDDSHEHWRKETVSFDAAYGGERVLARLYLPKKGALPLQTVLYVPSTIGELTASSENTPEEMFFNYIVRSGRAVILIAIKETYERNHLKLPLFARSRPNEVREIILQQTKDVSRTIDYVATRSDLNLDKLAYCGMSTVWWWGSIHAAVEPRIKVIVFLSGGLAGLRLPAEINPSNYAPRVKIPALMVNGRYDPIFSVETSQVPLFNLLGTPAKDKRHAIIEGGHAPSRPEMIKETLAWLDKYLGPVN